MNLAAVNYYFGSKEVALCRDDSRGVSGRSMKAALLRFLQRAGASKPPRPTGGAAGARDGAVGAAGVPLSWIRTRRMAGHHIIRILGRSLAEPLPLHGRRAGGGIPQPTMARFQPGRAPQRAPQLSPEDFLWRLQLCDRRDAAPPSRCCIG